MPIETLTISRRFCGPSMSGNGGYVCGLIARHIVGAATVRLTAPPPLETPLRIEASGEDVRLLAGRDLIGEGRAAELDLTAPAPPSFAEAAEASQGYLGFSRHSFPRCFVCGPQRREGDGLRIFAGPVEGRGLVAAPWYVDESLADGPAVPSEFMWAALDCPSGFAVVPVREGQLIVLGQLTARIDAGVRPGDRCIALGWPIAIEGRKRISGSALYSEAGQVLAVARATWIELPQSAFPAEGGAPPSPSPAQ
jgi:hypothetical protein